MTERTLALLRSSGLPFELRYTGASAAKFQAWLGDAVPLAEQGEGDLGARMARATAGGASILVGADLPDLALQHLEQAVAALRTHPAVIGPAEDGGYWLIGLQTPMPFLFEPMAWGTGVVFAQTMDRFAAHGIGPAVLEQLPDLDRPEDLRRWPDLTGP